MHIVFTEERQIHMKTKTVVSGILTVSRAEQDIVLCDNLMILRSYQQKRIRLRSFLMTFINEEVIKCKFLSAE